MTERWQVFLLDHLTQIEEITAFDRCRAIQKDLYHGNWEIVLSQSNLDVGAVTDKVLGARWLGLEIVDNDTGWRYSGPATYLSRTYSGAGQVAKVEIRGVDWMDRLDALLEYPDPFSAFRWWVTSVSSQQLSVALTNGFAFDGGPSALVERRIPSLRIVDPPAPFGPTKAWTSTGRPLIELWRPWFEGTDWTFRLDLVRATTGDEIQFTPTPRAVAPTIATPGLQGDVTITEIAASATTVIVMGDKDPAATDPNTRHVAVATRPETGWRTMRRERAVNSPSAVPPTLQVEADAEVASSGPTRTITVPDFEIAEFGLTTRIGDLVRVHYDDSEPELLVPIGATTVTGTSEGWKRTVSIGREVLVGARQVAANNADLASRLRRLEGHL